MIWFSQRASSQMSSRGHALFSSVHCAISFRHTAIELMILRHCQTNIRQACCKGCSTEIQRVLIGQCHPDHLIPSSVACTSPAASTKGLQVLTCKLPLPNSFARSFQAYGHMLTTLLTATLSDIQRLFICPLHVPHVSSARLSQHKLKKLGSIHTLLHRISLQNVLACRCALQSCGQSSSVKRLKSLQQSSSRRHRGPHGGTTC